MVFSFVKTLNRLLQMIVFPLITPAAYLFFILVALILLYFGGHFLFTKIGKDPKNILPLNFAQRIRIPFLILLFCLFLILMQQHIEDWSQTASEVSRVLTTLGIILSIAWGLIIVVKVFKNRILKKYNLSEQDNLKARKVYTQFIILENIIIFIIVVLAIGIALMSFTAIRAVGVSILTSAGIAGIIIGFAAQKALGTLLAGIQIAITQPIRIDDAVIIEGEWGWIEEITLTYIVLRIWDKRRLIIPSTYFIENTFENWTRTTSDILGTVFLYTDYSIPLDKLREEFTRLLEASPYWDGEVNVIQVTNTSETTMELRALMSSGSSSNAWELRVYIREHLLEFIRKNYPESLPRVRVDYQKNEL